MAVLTVRSRPAVQVFRLLGILVAMLLMMMLGLGIARLRAMRPGGSPYGALTSVDTRPVAQAGAPAVAPAAAAALPDGDAMQQTQAVPAPLEKTATIPPAPLPAPPANTPAPSDAPKPGPRVISMRGGVDPTPARPVAAAAVPAASVTAPPSSDAAAPDRKDAPAVMNAVDRTDDATPAGVININTASVEDLNHIPGAGRIGRTIVRHRPYSSVQDLVDHRVLRASEFARIRGKLTAN